MPNTSSIRLLCALGYVALGCGLPFAAAADDGPTLATFWRSFFARPAGPPPAPADNPTTPAKIELGRILFETPALSGDGRRSCRTCHDPDRAFTDGRGRALARDGSDLARNAPSLMNLAWAKSFMWDGRADSLEAQVLMPLLDPREMAGSWPDIVAALKRDVRLDVTFHTVFRERPAIQPNTVVAALAAYVRSLVSPRTRFDRWVDGDDAALSTQELAGFGLFVGKAGCVACHGTWRFTDDKFHDVGLADADPGRGAVAGGVPGLPAFKTPSLRELDRTAPYMHDGSTATLEAVIDHYAGSDSAAATLVARPSLDTSLVRDLRLSPEEKAALTAFLRTL